MSRNKPRRPAVPRLPEFRDFPPSGLEVRSTSETDELILTGEPIVYSRWYRVYDGFGDPGYFEERMMPGVASDVLASNADVRLLINHSRDGIPLARTSSGTMTLEDTPTALKFTAELDARMQTSNDAYYSVARGDLSAMSVGFTVDRDSWDNSGPVERRTVHSLGELLECSLVAFPASPSTSVKAAQAVQRMGLEMPVESRARLRKLYYDASTGKRGLSDSEFEMVKIMLSTGLEPNQAIGRRRDGAKASNPHSHRYSEQERKDLVARAEAAIGRDQKARARAIHLRAEVVRQGLG